MARRVLHQPCVRAERALAPGLRVCRGRSAGRRRDHRRLPPPARARPGRGFPRRAHRRAHRRLHLGREPARLDARAGRADRLNFATMIDIPQLETERLRLTAFGERHFEAYASMLADASSTRFIGDGEPLDRMNAWRSMAMLLGHWALRGYGMWAVELRHSGEFVGRVGLHYPEGWPDLELGWMLVPEHRRKGYATEA